MIGNYIKLAARNLVKRKFYSFINSFGLSLAIAFCILIYLYTVDEKSFDQFHENKDDIVLLTEMHLDPEAYEKGDSDPYRYSASMPAMFAEVLREEAPGVKHVTRFCNDQGVMRYGDNIFKQQIHYADSGFFSMFSFPLVRGSLNMIFQNPNEAVLTEEVARKYFGDEDPIGRIFTFQVREPKTFIVVAVIQDAPSNSSLDFKMLLPVQNRPFFEEHRKHWGFFSYNTFVQLDPLAKESFPLVLDAIAEKYTGDETRKWRQRENIPGDVAVSDFGFTVLDDLHLNTQISWNRSSNPSYAYILSCIAVLILIVAGINYISLALTTSASRRVEVGIRKVAGAQRTQLIYQFGSESAILALFSMVIGVAFAGVLLPAFNEFTGKNIDFNAVNPIRFATFAVGISLVLGMFAGMYPAFVLSAFRPVAVLKGRSTSKLNAGFSKPLVILQFALSAFLVISSVIMYRQMKFVTTKDLGYNKDQVLVVPTLSPGKPSDGIIAQFRNKIAGESLVLGVTGSSATLDGDASYYGYKVNGENKSASVYSVDPQYIPLLDIRLLEGRNFDERIASDTNTVIVNEALVKDMRWKEPLNEYLNWREDNKGQGAKVIGVVKDYHFISLENQIGPMFLSMDKDRIGHLNYMIVKLSARDIPLSLDRVHKTWKQLNPDKPFEYSFLDEGVAQQYDKYTRWMKIAGLSAAFAILIASLGLFGLAGINAVNRTKEIGIRKVMGAEVWNILVLLNKQYVWISLLAFAVATPFSWYVMHQWIANFEFKITIGWEIFLLVTAAGIAIAIITVSYHSIKPALINPAETLKYE